MRPADLAGLTALATFWGTTFLLVELSLADTGPAGVVLVRLAVGGLLLVVLARLRKVRLPDRAGTWLRVAGMGLVGQALPFLLFAWGQEHVSGALAGVYTGATPLLTIPVVWLLLRQRPSTSELLASLVGFVGLAVVLSPWHGGASGSYLGQLLCLAGALCYALAYAYAAKLLASVTDDKYALAAAQALCGAAFMLPLAGVGGAVKLHVGPVAAVALLLLAIGTAGAFVCNYWLIARIGPVQASLAFYLIPVVAVVTGLLLGHDRLAAHEWVGCAFIVGALGILYAWERRTAAGAAAQEQPVGPGPGGVERDGSVPSRTEGDAVRAAS